MAIPALFDESSVDGVLGYLTEREGTRAQYAYSSAVDEKAIARMILAGTVAWKDVPDASAWVDDLRGTTQLPFAAKTPNAASRAAIAEADTIINNRRA